MAKKPKAPKAAKANKAPSAPKPTKEKLPKVKAPHGGLLIILCLLLVLVVLFEVWLFITFKDRWFTTIDSLASPSTKFITAFTEF